MCAQMHLRTHAHTQQQQQQQQQHTHTHTQMHSELLTYACSNTLTYAHSHMHMQKELTESLNIKDLPAFNLYGGCRLDLCMYAMLNMYMYAYLTCVFMHT